MISRRFGPKSPRDDGEGGLGCAGARRNDTAEIFAEMYAVMWERDGARVGVPGGVGAGSRDDTCSRTRSERREAEGVEAVVGTFTRPFRHATGEVRGSRHRPQCSDMRLCTDGDATALLPGSSLLSSL